MPNHTSDAHVWFQQALAAAPGSPERERYMFRDGRGEAGELPPNNWESVFGGPAWTRTPDGQWYLHLFDSTQPDLDWRNPEVPAMFEDVLRFWLHRGVDGFRVDVAHGLFKEASLRDQVVAEGGRASSGQVNTDHSMVSRDLKDEPMWDQPEVHDVYRAWHRVLDEAGPDRMAVAEARHGGAAGRIDIASAFRVDQLDALAADGGRIIRVDLPVQDARHANPFHQMGKSVYSFQPKSQS